MLEHSFHLIIRVFKTLVYCTLFAVGCYFIYEGQVIQRYTLGRTNFAEFDEELREFPTIVFFIDDGDKNSSYTYGTDFLIHYGIEANLSSGNNDTVLSLGETKLPGTSLSVDLEPILDGSTYKITPINFKPSMPFHHILAIYFNDLPGHNVALRLTTENNSVDVDGKVHDGDRDFTNVSPGETKFLTVNAEKQKFLKRPKECRTVPFNEIFLRKTSEEMKERCKNPCKPDKSFGKRLNENIQHLPMCKSEEEKNCMMETAINVVSDVTLKPCTRVTYKTQTATMKQPSENMAIFDLEFVQPPTINVREEYLIYDTVAMISAIGGTMGLCIGISFYNIMGTGLD